MNRITALVILTGFGLCSGCRLIGILGTPTASETKVPAEYEIRRRAEGGIIVLVQQPGWLNVQTDLRPVLSEAVNVTLWKKAKVDKKAIVGYERLVEFRQAHPDFSSLSPEQIATGLDAKTILLVAVEDYRLYELPLDGYYKGLHKGLLDIRGYVLDAQSGEVLWPQSGKGKLIRLALEAEQGGKEACAAKLSKAAAHCIVRYFYGCKKDKFRVWGERPDISKGEEW
jgi:hypothetical protein